MPVVDIAVDASTRNKTERGRDKSNSSQKDLSKKGIWKSATDPATGRKYYYDSVTRKTQWKKPAEIKAIEEKERLERRNTNLEFFRDMEKNILESMSKGELIPGIPFRETKKEGPPKQPQRSPRVRTISGMDEVLLAELRDDNNALRQQPRQRRHSTTLELHSATTSSADNGRPPLPFSRGTNRSSMKPSDSMEFLSERGSSIEANTELKKLLRGCDTLPMGGKLFDAPIHSECDVPNLATSPPSGHRRRNTGGTIYVQNTMTNPDIKATIKCVCSVYRAHIVQAAERKSDRSPVSAIEQVLDTDVFYDEDEPRRQKKSKTPTLQEVLAFYEEFYRRSRMEHDTIIMSLIYVERLVKATDGVLTPCPENWRSALFACMVLASKVWDDLSMWNIDFSNVSASTAGFSSFTLKRINQLELTLLKNLNFDVKVHASEYAKYYFLIRTMLIRSGLVENVERPLGKEEAFDKLWKSTTNYQETKLARPNRVRAKSLNSDWKNGDTDSFRHSACLEQLVG